MGLQLETDSAAAPPPAARAGWQDSRRPYVVLALVLFALLSVQTLNRQWSTDYWMYTATIHALREDVRDPPQDMTGTTETSERYTPYTVALATVERATGISNDAALEWAALVNLAVLLVAFELFVTELTGRKLVAFFALLATLVMWGIQPWRWSGFLNLNSIGFGLAWPSTLATGLALLAGWALLRYDKSGSWWWLAVVGVGMAIGALSHPYTAGWAAVLLLALVVHCRLYRRDRVVPLLVAGAVALALVVVWPYYPFLELGSKGDAAYSSVMDVMYEHPWWRVIAALPGFVVVIQRFRRDRTDALALMLFGGVALYLFGAVADIHSFGRTLPVIMLAAHIGIGILVADFVERRRPASVPWIAWLSVSFAIGLVGVAPAFARFVPRPLLPSSLRDRVALQPITSLYDGLDGALPSGTVVVAQKIGTLNSIAPAFDMYVVSPGYPTAFVKDLPARRRDSATFLAPDTPAATRNEIAQRYGIRAVLCSTSLCAQTFADGDIVAHGRNYTLIRLPT
jgi:hypothetical protein